MTRRLERRKAELRADLIESAIVLFAQHGVEATSVEQIAARADVSPRTFHRYFHSKHDVLFSDAAEHRTRLEEALRDRPDDEPLLTSILEALVLAVAPFAERPEHEAVRLRIIERHDALRAVSLRRTEEWAAIIAGHVATQLGIKADDALAAVVGSCAVAALRAARVRWLDDDHLDLATEIRISFALLGDLSSALGR